jgi:CubicO group peptidase (beta-lactamase class C family)
LVHKSGLPPTPHRMRFSTWPTGLLALASIAFLTYAPCAFSQTAPAAEAQAPPAKASLEAQVQQDLDAFLAQHHALDQLSGAVLVADRGKVVYQGAFGMANSDWEIPNTPATKFRLASITKQFTAMLVLQLVRDGQLELDAPITRYLPDYPAESGDKVSVHQLLNHTSGIPSYTERPGFMQKDAKERMSVAEFVKKYCSEPLEFEPGSQFSYNNSGYFLLGAIIEAVTSQTYAGALQEYIFDPLDMHNSGVDDQYRVIPGRAAGYDDILGSRRGATWMEMTTPFAAGAIYSTVGDMWKWDQALRDKRLLDGELERLMYTPGMGDYAFGWEVSNLPAESGGSVFDGADASNGSDGQASGAAQDSKSDAQSDAAPTRLVLYHSGGMPGVSTLIWRVPSEDRVIIILGNTMQTSTYSIRRGITEILAGRDPGPVRARGDFEIARTVLEHGDERALVDLAKWPETTRNDYIRPDVIGIGHQLIDRERHAEALQLFTFLTLAFPDDPIVWDSLAYGYRQSGDIEAAITNYKKVLELDPTADSIRDLIQELE